MNKIKIIRTAKRLINLPYNKFNLENYYDILNKEFSEIRDVIPYENKPIKLMSGNHEEAKIVRIDESWKKHQKRKIYIVGKGILFDSGGLNLKPDDLNEMTGDKAGMIIALSVAEYFKGNVIAYCPVTTNFIHTSKITPGDEINIGKKIVKVIDTDAEGRLILAEALSNINQNKDDIIITIATLTGAVGYAIGDKATGVFTNNEKLYKEYEKASLEEKEYIWRLPLWDYLQKKHYDKKIIENEYGKKIKEGATEAALFVKQFVPYPNNWIHLDIAYSAFAEGKATGVPIKSLINFIKKIK